MLRANERFLRLIGAVVLCFLGGCCRQAGTDACNKQVWLRHVVLIEFKETATEEQIKQTEEMFCEMARGIEEVEDFEWGTDVSGGERTEGYTHCFILTFADEAGRDKYQTNAAHNELRAVTRPYIKKMLAFDYWQRKN